MTDAWAVLLPDTGSDWSPLIVAVVVIIPVRATRATMVKALVAPLARAPTVQIPLAGS